MAQPGLLLDDRYRLDDRIAAGGMGEVWRATDIVLSRQVAVKLVRPHYAQDAEGLARFRAEARYAASLQHPNIAMVYDYWEGDPPGQPYLVMELVNGPSLAGVLARGPIGPATTMDVVAQTAAGLQAAHAAGLVHRDIKPANLLVSKGGRIKITDFGIARAGWDAALTSTGQVVGTVAYMAPERVTGVPATPAADLYALGVVAHECLTGQRPFEGHPMAVALAHQQQGLPPLPTAVPAEVARLVADLTAKDPGARPVSAGQVAQRAEHLRTALTGAVAFGGIDAMAGPMAGPDSGTQHYAGTGADAGSGTYPGTGASPGSEADLDEGGRGGRRNLRTKLLAGGLALAGLATAGVVAWLVVNSPAPKPPRHPAPAQAPRHPASPGNLAASPPASAVSTGEPQPAGPAGPAVPPATSQAPAPTPAASPSLTSTATSSPAEPTTTPTLPTPATTPTDGAMSPGPGAG